MSVSDNFNRADSGSLGANWTETVHGLQIAGNAALAINNGVYQRAYYSGVSWNADHSSQALLSVGTDCGLLARFTGADTGYMLEGYGGNGNVALYRVDAGATYTLLQYAATGFVSGDTLKLSATGSTLRYYKNGSQIGTDQSDATYATGSPGVYAGYTSDKLDDWIGTGEASSGGVFSWANYYYRHVAQLAH